MLSFEFVHGITTWVVTQGMKSTLCGFFHTKFRGFLFGFWLTIVVHTGDEEHFRKKNMLCFRSKDSYLGARPLLLSCIGTLFNENGRWP